MPSQGLPQCKPPAIMRMAAPPSSKNREIRGPVCDHVLWGSEPAARKARPAEPVLLRARMSCEDARPVRLSLRAGPTKSTRGPSLYGERFCSPNGPSVPTKPGCTPGRCATISPEASVGCHPERSPHGALPTPRATLPCGRRLRCAQDDARCAGEGRTLEIPYGDDLRVLRRRCRGLYRCGEAPAGCTRGRTTARAVRGYCLLCWGTREREI